MKILGGEKLEHQINRGNHKKKGDQILKFQCGEAEGGGTNFDADLLGGSWKKLWEHIPILEILLGKQQPV